jgi:D-alanine-D-alanine ligase
MEMIFMRTQRVAILFGGVSPEHDVSLLSAKSVIEHLPKDKYEIVMLGIKKTGEWMLYKGDVRNLPGGAWENDPSNVPAFIPPDSGVHGIIVRRGSGCETIKIDTVFPVLHGSNGEDGTVQGLLKLAGIPFVGCDVLASAICMDKAVACTLFEAAGIPHCPWASYTEYQLKCDLDGCCEQLEYKLGYPMFVKPANAGSSVGISKALDRYTLRTAIEMALREDSKLIFEAAVDGQEVECAVLGSDPALATRPGEILAGAEFYTYDDKYKNGVSQVVIPARLSDEKLDEVRLLAAKAYTAVGCEGLARCDFFVEKSGGRVLINEINTFPGFTPISMYPKLMEHQGLPVNELIDELIALAMERADRAREKNHG